MSMSEEEWRAVEPLFKEPSTWLLVGGVRESYVPLFEGTLDEAVAEALRHAAFWETTTTVVLAPEGRYGTKKVEVAKVSPIRGSPIRP